MKKLWRRIAGLGPAELETLEELFQASGYAQEYMEAFERTETPGLPVPAVRVLVKKDCVNLETVTPHIHRYLGECGSDAVVGQAFAINVNIIPYLHHHTGIPFTLTMGWFEDQGRELYRHDEALLRRLLRDGIGSFYAGRLGRDRLFLESERPAVDQVPPDRIGSGVSQKDRCGAAVGSPA